MSLTPLQEAEIATSPDNVQIMMLKKHWLEQCQNYHDELMRVATVSRMYYKGWQTNYEMLASYESHAVENRLFLADETMVPLVTSRIPDLQITPPKFEEASVALAEKLEKVMDYLFHQTDLQHKSEISIRAISHNRYFVWHPFWNEEKGEIDFRYIPPDNCFFPRFAFNDLPYFIEMQEYTLPDLVAEFGEDAVDKVQFGVDTGLLTKIFGFFSASNDDSKRNKALVWAVWTKNWCAYVGKNDVLRMEQNPTWRTAGRDGVELTTLEEQKKINHFNYPQIPYIIGTIYEDGGQTVGITSLYEQGIPMQDVINKTIRYYVDYMEEVGDPIWLVDSSVMDRDESDQITSEAGRKYWGNGIADERKFRRAKPPEMPAYIPNMLATAQNSFDNIYGSHSSTRGEDSKNPTLGQDVLQKQADTGRTDILARVLGRAINALGDWYIQYMMLKYDETRDIPVLDNADEFNFVKDFSNEMIEKGVKFQTKPGTTLPDDKATRAELFLKLSQTAPVGMRPRDLYKALGLNDPQGLEDDLIKWQSGQLQASLTPPALSTVPPAIQPVQ